MADKRAFVIYAERSKIIRRIIVTDEEKFNIMEHIQSKEDYLEVSHDYADITGAEFIIEEVTLKKPESSRCAVVDSYGNVIQVVHADPELDKIEGYKLIQTDKAFIGDAFTKEDTLVERREIPYTGPGPLTNRID